MRRSSSCLESSDSSSWFHVYHQPTRNGQRSDQQKECGSPDRADNKFLAAAVEGKADYLVSADKKHLLSLGEYEGIHMLTARQFISKLDETDRPEPISNA